MTNDAQSDGSRHSPTLAFLAGMIPAPLAGAVFASSLALLSLPWAVVLAFGAGILAVGATLYGDSVRTDQRAHQLYNQAGSKSNLVFILVMSTVALPLYEWIPLPQGMVLDPHDSTSLWVRFLPLLLYYTFWLLAQLYSWLRQRQPQ
jgi:hypothetical protein